jgi:hypothetical protein
MVQATTVHVLSFTPATPSAQAALELAGLSEQQLPTLAYPDDVDPSTTVLVKASE